MPVETSGRVNANWEWTSSVPDLNDSFVAEPPSTAWPEAPDWRSLGRDVVNPLLTSAFSFADEHLTRGSSGLDQALGIGVKSGARWLEALTAPFFGQAEPKALSPDFMQLKSNFTSHPWTAVSDYLSQTNGAVLATDGVLATQAAIMGLAGGALLKMGGAKVLRLGAAKGVEQSQRPSEAGNGVDFSADNFWQSLEVGGRVELRENETYGFDGWRMRASLDEDGQVLTTKLRNLGGTPNKQIYQGLIQWAKRNGYPFASVETTRSPLTDDPLAYEFPPHDTPAPPNKEFELFTKATQSRGLSNVAAARESALGQAALKNGFTKVEAGQVMDTNGKIESVWTKFSKPPSSP